MDGDKLHEQLEAIARPPAEPADVSTWLSTSEQTWQDHLRKLCHNAPKTTVHGRILRWSKESVVLAGYDRDAVKQHLGIDVQTPAVRDHLARCTPAPTSVATPDFSSTFPRPLRCLTDLDAAQRAPRPAVLAKNAPELDDTLRMLARDDCHIVAGRVPDIDRLADLIWKLATNAPPAAAPPVPPVKSPPTKRPPRAAKR